MNGNEAAAAGDSQKKAPEAPPSPSTPTRSNNPLEATNQFVAAVQKSHDELPSGIKRQAMPSPSLVQPSASGSIKKPTHNRNVSWGMPTMSPPPANRMPLPSWDGTTLSGSKKDDLNVIDIINAGGQTELEAETYILQAVDKMSSHQRGDTEVSGLYNSIASDEIRSSKSSNVVADEEHEAPYEDEKPKLPRPRGAGRQASVMSMNTANSRFKGLIRQDRMKSDTVEGTLFGLASALSELDGSTSHSKSRSHDDDAEKYETKFTSADKLANAAHKILNEGKEDKNHSNGGDSSQGQSDKDARSSRDGKKRKSGGKRLVQGATKGAKEEWELFNTYFSSRRASIKAYANKIFMMSMLPCLGIAFFLFYIVENPDLCPAEKRANITDAPTMAPSFAPSMSPSSSPTEFNPWLIAWVGNGTPPETFNETNATMVPNATEAPVEESIFDEIGKNLLVCPGLGASAS